MLLSFVQNERSFILRWTEIVFGEDWEEVDPSKTNLQQGSHDGSQLTWNMMLE